MAAVLTHRGFRAYIMDKGRVQRPVGESANDAHRPLPVYGVSVDNITHQVSCWIASEEKHAFSVHWENESAPDVVTAAYIYLDGFKVAGRFLMGIGRCDRDGIRSSHTTQKPFVFEYTGDHSSSRPQGDVARSYEAGSIVLRIKRVKILKNEPPRPANGLQRIPAPLAKGAEGSQQVVGFGSSEPCPEQHSSTWRCESEGTYVTFAFHYRSKAFIQDMGWPMPGSIPPTPSSTEYSPSPSQNTLPSSHHSSQVSLLEVPPTPVEDTPTMPFVAVPGGPYHHTSHSTASFYELDDNFAAHD